MSGVYALVPARGGSKGVPGKNLREIGGHPLIAYSVVAGLRASEVDRVIVTTDSEEIAEVAAKYGAEIPFRRPAGLASDTSTDADYVRHALDWLEREEGMRPELVVQLRPTTPLRDPILIDEAVRALRAAPEATSLRSAHELPEPPQKMFGIEDGYFVGLFPDDPRPEYFNLPRQSFPPAYHPNGYVDVLRASHLLSAEDRIYGPRILAFITPPTPELDTPDDMEHLQMVVARTGHPLVESLRGVSASGHG